jgi:ribosomal protein S18 acetylase RimI-like enzyme
MNQNVLHIIKYQDEHQPFFERINRNWIEKYFWLEPNDDFVLRHPDKAILQLGGSILLITSDKILAGTAALKKINEDDYELTKMAVDEPFRGKGLGKELCKAAIDEARSAGAKRILLYSNTLLKPAIQLYKKLGFTEIPLEKGVYARSDIKMELWLTNVSVIRADISHADAIASIGRESFHDAFIDFFIKQVDMDHYLDYTYEIQKIKTSIAKPNNVFFLALQDGEPTGFAKVKRQSHHSLLAGDRHMELQKIYLRKIHQREGIGSTLMRSVATLAAELKPAYIWLDVLIGNTKAINFYATKGFKKFGTHFFTIGSQTFEYHIMALPLSSGTSIHLSAAHAVSEENPTKTTS